MKILIIGSTASTALEISYFNAAKISGYEVKLFDPEKEITRYIRGGKIGMKLNQFLPVEQWIRKMNRELVLTVLNYLPDRILLFTKAKILPGTLATIKTIFPTIKIVWIWPDTPLNLEANNILNAPLIDLVATYSYSTISIFKKFGFQNVEWIPLAGDPIIHGTNNNPENEFICDISFIGGWRPEREKSMTTLINNFPNKNIQIYGPYWAKQCKNRAVAKKILGKGLYGKQMALLFSKSRININIIDDTNYPAANMRFFEILIAGGLELCSACPEMENEFQHGRDIYYFDTQDQLIVNVHNILADNSLTNRIRNSGFKLVSSKHTYESRLRNILIY